MNQWLGHNPRLLLDQQLRVKRASSSLCRTCGMPADVLIGTRIEDWVNLDPEFVLYLRRRLACGGTSWQQTFPLRLPGYPMLAARVMLRSIRGRRGSYILVTLREIQSHARMNRPRDLAEVV